MADGVTKQRIQKLPDNLINQIAAGEVIERPASVVKELLENSLDATATKISVEIKSGGSQLILVQDNGHGIHKDDLTLALGRHATSKLDSQSDLSRITTLGFRGEALSSIASVSKLKLVSRQIESPHAWAVTYDGGITLRPAAHPPGSTVEARDLFYNVPARRKFLRSEKTESLHIQEIVKRVALCRFNLAIHYMQNGHKVLQLSDDSKDPSQRINTVMGRRFLNNCLVVDDKHDEMLFYGWAGLPEMARSQSDQQYFYLNGRIVRDKLINHAIRLAYEDYLYPGRHPAYVLYLEMDHAAADINVHPTKQEVRFRDARTVHDVIYSCLARLLYEKHDQKHKASTKSWGFTSKPDEKIAVNEIRSGYSETRSFAGTERQQTPDVPLTQIKGRFLIVENADGIVLYDIYSMRELVNHTRLLEEYKSGSVNSRPILVPLHISVKDYQIDMIDKFAELLEEIGIMLQQISPEAIQIRTIPVLLPYADTMLLIKDIFNILEKHPVPENIVDNLILLLSKHTNDCPPVKMDLRELNQLLNEFFALKSKIPEKQFSDTMRLFDLEALQVLINGKNKL